MDKWADYSAGKLTGDALKKAGFVGAVRYIDDITNPSLTRSKHTSRDEYNSLLSAGLSVALVFEVSTSDPDGGYAAGQANARRALAGANYLGYHGPIFFCNDRPDLPNASTWQAYLDGAASILGRERVGAYGFKAAVNAAIRHASVFWQAGRQSDVQPHVHLYQWNNGNTKVANIVCDINYLYKPFSVAGGGSAVPAPTGTPIVVLEG